MRRFTRTALILAAVTAMAAPAAQARVASEPASPGSGSHLTVGQLHRVDGNQPVALAAAEPVEVTPVSVPDAGGADLTPWLFIAVPLGLLLTAGGARKVSHKTLIPRRNVQHA
jgi:hypothetical protein